MHAGVIPHFSLSGMLTNILKTQVQKFPISCKSFLLRFLQPALLFFLCMMSQPLLQLWYFFTCRAYLRDFWIRSSWEVPLLPLGGTEGRGKQFSFVTAGCSRVLLGSSDLPLPV